MKLGLRMACAGLVLLLGVVGFSSFSWAEGSNRALNHVERNLIHLRLGFSGATLLRGGVQYPVNIIGSGLNGLFDGSPQAMELANSYRTLRVTGFALWLVGLATLGAELVMLAVQAGGGPAILMNPGGGLSPVFWGMTIGGGVIGLVGGFLISYSNVLLSRAVAAFNRDLFSRARSRRWSMHFHIMPDGGGMVAIRGKF